MNKQRWDQREWFPVEPGDIILEHAAPYKQLPEETNHFLVITKEQLKPTYPVYYKVIHLETVDAREHMFGQWEGVTYKKIG